MPFPRQFWRPHDVAARHSRPIRPPRPLCPQAGTTAGYGWVSGTILKVSVMAKIWDAERRSILKVRRLSVTLALGDRPRGAFATSALFVTRGRAEVQSLPLAGTGAAAEKAWRQLAGTVCQPVLHCVT